MTWLHVALLVPVGLVSVFIFWLLMLVQTAGVLRRSQQPSVVNELQHDTDGQCLSLDPGVAQAYWLRGRLTRQLRVDLAIFSSNADSSVALLGLDGARWLSSQLNRAVFKCAASIPSVIFVPHQVNNGVTVQRLLLKGE